ncbi:MAG: prolipoprotein diacylglyceryl transferase, partial [Myxococcota bacterium]
RLLRVWEGGLVFHGGLIGGIVATWRYTHKYRISFFFMADVIVPTLALGQFFGRIGCFAAGCCFGKSSTLPWAQQFPGVLARKGLLHPTQLYEALGVLVLFFVLLIVRHRKRFHGQVLVAYMMLYGALRFVIEIFRGDLERGFLFQWDAFPTIGKAPFQADLLTWGQTISIFLVVFGFVLMVLAKWNRSSQKKSAF